MSAKWQHIENIVFLIVVGTVILVLGLNACSPGCCTPRDRVTPAEEGVER